MVLGVVVGFMLGVTSAGSGALIAVGLILIFRLVPTRVVGTDVFHAAILLWSAALAHLVSGNIDFALAGTILLGSVPGVWVGSSMSVRVPADALRTTLAIVLLGSGLGLLAKSGAGVPGYVLAGFPVSVAALMGWVTLRDRRRAASMVPAAGAVEGSAPQNGLPGVPGTSSRSPSPAERPGVPWSAGGTDREDEVRS